MSKRKAEPKVNDDFLSTLQVIARGKPYISGSKPYNGEEARQQARVVLVRHGIDWSQPRAEMRRGTCALSKTI